ncbi:MAG: T9SS type A sorting domain-containing protein [Muribaculaceae bacterium]|nr:T9SS type A sorting domain-containing protein [Muribaculaceae bacterium]
MCANADGIKVALDKGIVKVYNAQGALVMQARHDGGIFTADLPKGIYIVSVR